VIASDSGTNNSTGLAKRQYFFFTNVPVTINVKPPGYGTISPAFTFGFKAIEGANQLPDAMGFTITANPKLSPHRIFVNWTDDQNNILGTARALKFTVTSNMVINANFQ
jgi:hypothetical protein